MNPTPINPLVISAGEMLFDRLSNDLGKPIEQVQSWTDYPGGAPANTACALVKLGIPTAFVGCIGQDSPGDTLVQLLDTVGVNLTGVQRHPTAPTRIIYVVRDETGDRSFAGFGDQDTRDFADTRLQGDQLPIDLFKTAKFWVVGTLELAYPDSYAALTQGMKLAKASGVNIFIDVNWRPVFWSDPEAAIVIIKDWVKQADFLKLTDEEANLLFGTTDAHAIAQEITTLKGVFVTAGERGCAYFLNGYRDQLPAFPVEVVDTTGAGDGFTAGIIYQFCQHPFEEFKDPQRIKTSVLFASAVGALTTMKPGAIAAQPTLAEVETFLKNWA